MEKFIPVGKIFRKFRGNQAGLYTESTALYTKKIKLALLFK